jgi:zinc transport system substrate-binding protein
MLSNRLRILATLAIGLIAALLLIGCAPAQTPQLKVVTSTSLLSCIVQQVGGDKVDVVNIVPSAQHPGDFDVKPGDIRKLADADLFLVHGWPGEKYVPNLVASANNSRLTVVTISMEGNWMTPPVQLGATDKVAATLSQIDSQNSPTYQKLAGEYKTQIQVKETDIKARLNRANVSQVNIIASIRQADFLQWAGFNVVATFTGSDSLTPQVLKDLTDKGKAAKVALVVNNLQDGADAGKGLAQEIGARNVNLSNFPGGFANTETWEKAIDYNINEILTALAR